MNNAPGATPKPKKRGKVKRSKSAPLPAGPFLSQSSDPKIRARATSADRKAATSGRKSVAKRVRRYERKDAQSAALSVPTLADTIQKATKETKKAAQSELKLDNALDLLRDVPPDPRTAIAQAREHGARMSEKHAKSFKNLYGDKAFKKVEKARYDYIGKHEDLGEPEDLTTLITVGVPGAIGAAQLARGVAKVGIKEISKQAATQVVGKGEATVAKTAAKAAAPKAAKRVVKNVGRRAAGKETIKRAPKPTPQFSAHVPGTVAFKAGAGQTLPVVRGHEKALTEHPGTTLKTTARALPGLVTVPIGIAANVGTTVGRGASTGLHEAGVPGFKGYTGDEILGPVSEEAKAQLEFAKQTAAVITADDSAEVQKAVEEELGLMLPVMLGLTTGAGVKRVSKGRIQKAVRQTVEKARKAAGTPRGTFRGQEPRVFEKSGQRKGEAVRAANARGRIRREVEDRTAGVKKAAHKAEGEEVVRKGVVAKKKLGKKYKGDLKVKAGDIVPFAVRHGLPIGNAKASLAEVKRIKNQLEDVPDGMELPADRLSTRDLIAYIEKNPSVLGDKDIKTAVAEYKKQAAEARTTKVSEDRPLDVVSPDHSERARFSSAAVTRNIPLPEERVLPELRKGNAKTWADQAAELEKGVGGAKGNIELARKQERIANSGKEQALKTLDRHRRSIQKRRESGKEPTPSQTRDLAQASGVYKQTKLRAKDAKSARVAAEKDHAALKRQVREAADAAAGKRKVRAQLTDAERKAIKDTNPDDLKAAFAEAKVAKQREVGKGLTKEFTDEVEGRLLAEGMELPEYISTARAKEAPAAGATGAPVVNIPGKSKFKKGTAEKMGIVEEGLGPSLRRSVSQPVSRRESYKALINFLDHNELRIGKKSEFTSGEARKLFDDPNSGIDRSNYVLVPRQLYKRAVDTFSPEDAAATLKVVLDDTDSQFSSRQYKIVRRHASEEFLNQMTNTLVSPAITKANQLTSALILGTSPAWAAMQVLAEYGQAAIAQPRLLNPKFVRKALKAYHDMDKRERLAFESWTGVTTRTIDSADELKLNLETGDIEAMGEAHKVMTSLMRFDKWKGGRIRTLTAAAKIDKDLNGRAARFERGIFGMNKEMGAALKAMEGKPLHEQLNWVAEHPKLAQKYQGYLDDVMGNWSALTKNERVAAQVMIFYPFMRMSLRWALYSFPKQHPIKAAIGLYLGQQNANELTKLLHGDPSFFKWGQVPLNLGDGETKVIDFSRIAPASNALLEGLGGTDNPSLVSGLRVIQPTVAAAVTAVTGVDQFTGEKEPEGFLNGVASLLTLPAPVRVADELVTPKGQKRSEEGAGKLPLTGILDAQEQNALDKLFAKLGEHRSLNKTVRTLALPTMPKRADYEADVAKAGRILDTLKENSSDDQDKVYQEAANGDINATEASKRVEEMKRLSSEARNELNAMYRKYKIPYKKEEVRNDDIYGRVIYGAKPDKATTLNGQPIQGGSVTPDNDLGKTTLNGQPLTLPKVGKERKPGKPERGTTLEGKPLGKVRRSTKQTQTTLNGVPIR